MSISMLHGSLVIKCGVHPLKCIQSLLFHCSNFPEPTPASEVLDHIAKHIGYVSKMDMFEIYIEQIIRSWTHNSIVESFPFSLISSYYSSVENFIADYIDVYISKLLFEGRTDAIEELLESKNRPMKSSHIIDKTPSQNIWSFPRAYSTALILGKNVRNFLT